jgi:hypothetical protein
VNAARVSSDKPLDLRVRLQRNPSAEVIAVVILDVAIHRPRDQALPVLIPGSSGLRSSDDRLGAGVLPHQGEDGGPRLLVEIVHVAHQCTHRSPELGV